MNYDAIFRPLFSFVAHATNSGPDGTNCVVDPLVVFSELEDLIAAPLALRHSSGGDGFEQAWFAVRAWLDETLAGLRDAGSDGPSARRPGRFADDDSGEEFFTRLDALLDGGAGGDNPERTEVIRVYASCLELGFLGRHRNHGDVATLERFIAISA